MLAYAETLGDPFSRDQLPAHFTASAVIVDPPGELVCMIHHKKLKRWLQPGGHFEPSDGGDAALAALREAREETSLERPVGLWAFWLMVGGMFGMTMAFAAAGIGQVYLERIIGLGFLETQRKIQVHFLMLTGTGLLFATGVSLYLWDFFMVNPRRVRAGGPASGSSPSNRAGTLDA